MATGLRVVLWITGIVLALMIVPFVLPWTGIERLFNTVGLTAPSSIDAEYFFRLSAALAALSGVFYIILALDPLRYGPMLPFGGIALIVMGGLTGIAGMMAGVPRAMYLADFAFCVVAGVLVVAFASHATAREPLEHHHVEEEHITGVHRVGPAT